MLPAMAVRVSQSPPRETAVRITSSKSLPSRKAVINYTIKVNKYSSATDLLKNNDYDLAYEAYLNLGPFKNSSEMALESLYQKAAAQL